MAKLFFLFLLLLSFVYGNDEIEIYATKMTSQGSVVNVTGGVTVVYKDYFLNAKEAKFNRHTNELELFGNIRATYKSNYKLLGNYAKLNIGTKERTFRPFFMLEKESNVWISGDEGCAKEQNIDISSGVISGCNPNKPLWKMEFSSSDYNSDSMWLNLYNARIYIYDIPVFYTPYFGYSLDTKRRTGLLTPALGLSDKEGFFYEQPIYIAEQNWWDLELKPQIRTNRGYGGYSTFRFIDSATSHGELTSGYFKEKKSYYLSEDLAHQTHYGFNFSYDNRDFLNQWITDSLEGQSGLYIDINNMNDVDYINIAQNDTTKNTTATQVLSRMNIFYNTDDNYIATYFKYYKDLTKQDNRDTLQKIPTLHYHYYIDTLFDDIVLYNLDLQSNNISRDTNQSVIQTNLDLPITFQTSLFDDYLNLSYTSKVYGQHSSFRGKQIPSLYQYRNGFFVRNYNVIEASTQLTKAFDTFTHVIGFGTTYTLGGSEIRNGFYDDTKDFCSDLNNINDARCEFYNLSSVDEALAFNFTQYFYDENNKEFLYHKLSQTINDINRDAKTGELENELDYTINDNLHFYNDMFFNFDEKSFSKIFNKVTYDNGKFNLSFSHLYKDTFLTATASSSPYTSYITSSVGYTYDSHYSYHARWDYDLEANLKKNAEIGFMYKKRCWDFGLRYLENNRPVLTQNSSSSIYDRYIYFTIVLKPLMKSGGGSSEFGSRLPDTFKGG